MFAKIFKILLCIVEAVCFTLGLFILVLVLTGLFSGGIVKISYKGEQLYCFSTDYNKNCLNSSEENKYEKD